MIILYPHIINQSILLWPPWTVLFGSKVWRKFSLLLHLFVGGRQKKLILNFVPLLLFHVFKAEVLPLVAKHQLCSVKVFCTIKTKAAEHLVKKTKTGNSFTKETVIDLSC